MATLPPPTEVAATPTAAVPAPAAPVLSAFWTRPEKERPCAGPCAATLPRSAFSSNQWKRKGGNPSKCKACSVDRRTRSPSGDGATAAEVGAGEKGGAGARPQGWREGDWLCTACGANVFASKELCFKCQAPRYCDTSAPPPEPSETPAKARAREPAAAPPESVVGGEPGGPGDEGDSVHGYTLEEIAVTPLCKPPPREAGDADPEWISGELQKLPFARLYPDIAERAVGIIASWRTRLGKAAWTRTMRRHRIFKELNEIAPVIARVEAELGRRAADAPPVTIVDLCSGFGYLSMFLSDMLPPAQVARIVLIDSMWPLSGAAAPDEPDGQINGEHIRNGKCWPIALHIRKQDIKKGRGARQLQKYVFEPSFEVYILGVHLCRALSPKAVMLWNDCAKATLLVLKPCCLPGRNLAEKQVRCTRAPRRRCSLRITTPRILAFVLF